MTNSPKVEVVFDPLVFADIFLCANLCPVEVSGLAKVRRRGNVFTVFGEPVVFEQICNMAMTDFDEKAHHLWIYQMIKKGRRSDIRECRLWWHSHVWGRVGFSHKDERTIENVLGGGLDEWWLSLVVNKKMQFNLRLDFFKPEKHPPIFLKDCGFTQEISVKDLLSIMRQREQIIDKIVEEKVKRVKAEES